jgi:protein transport protein SEC24
MLPHLKNRFQAQQQPETQNNYATTTTQGYNAPNPANTYQNQPTSPTNDYPTDSYQNANVAKPFASKANIDRPAPITKPPSQGYNDPTTSNTPTGMPKPSTPTYTQPENYQNANSKKSRQNKIDPDKIPRPDIEASTSYDPRKFQTSQKNPPPPSYSNFITTDDGNAGPRFIRSSFYKLPTEGSTLTNTHIPFGCVLQPLADPSPYEEGVPVIDYGNLGPFRCTRCKGYVNPNWMFVDGGNTGICNLCRMSNKVPREYYAPLNEFGHRRDRDEKMELCKGVYEFIAPQDYHTRALVTPHIVICIDVSSTSFVNGIFHQVINSLQSLLDYIPAPENTKIAIITYDTHINFFRVPENLDKDLQVICSCDLDDPCVPFSKDTFFHRLSDEREKIDFLIQRILKYYENFDKQSKGVYATCFGAALNNAMGLLLEQGGRAILFATQAPVSGLGKIKRRDDYKIYGTDKERSLFLPQIEDYEKIGKFCLEKRIGLDAFIFAQEYFDLTTIGQAINIVGGNIYFYPTYNSTFDGEKLHYDLARNLTRYLAYDAVMKVRTSQGISVTEYISPAGKRPLPDIEFSVLDADYALNVYFKIDEKIVDPDSYIQAAVLYTNQYGQRVIRVINLTIGTSSDLMQIFRCNDVEVASQLVLKRYFMNLSQLSLKTIKENVIISVVNILHAYRIHCAQTSSPAQLILPESLKLLPLYCFGALKSNILRLSNDVRPDDRSFDLHRFTRWSVNIFSNFLYTKIYALHNLYRNEEMTPGNLKDDKVILGPNIGASDERLESNGIYLFDNSENLYLYVKAQADPNLLQDLFGVETLQDISSLTAFPQLQTEYALRVNNIIEQLRKNKNGTYQAVRIVTEKDPLEPYLLTLLVEDESKFGESYGEFLCNAHKNIQAKIS